MHQTNTHDPNASCSLGEHHGTTGERKQLWGKTFIKLFRFEIFAKGAKCGRAPDMIAEIIPNCRSNIFKN